VTPRDAATHGLSRALAGHGALDAHDRRVARRRRHDRGRVDGEGSARRRGAAHDRGFRDILDTDRRLDEAGATARRAVGAIRWTSAPARGAGTLWRGV